MDEGNHPGLGPDPIPAGAGAGPAPQGSQADPQPFQQPQPQGRGTSFYVAIFLFLLLLVSAGLNLVLMAFGLLGGAGAGGGASGVSSADGNYEIVRVGEDSGAEKLVLRIPVDGAIVEQQSPVMGAPGGIVTRIKTALRDAEQQESIAGVILDINSPGGGVTDSDYIFDAVQEYRSRSGKPVVAVLGDLAASGGYYVAAACDHIIARETTITGSIGVIMSSYQYGDALRELGIKPLTIKSSATPYKDIMSPTREMTPDERQILQSIIDEMYEKFVAVVMEGRAGKMTEAEIRAAANGLIYSANQALERKLVDDIGDLDDALAWMEGQGAEGPFQMVEHRRIPGLRDLLFGVKGPEPLSLQSAAAQLLQGATSPRFLYYWQGAR